ncbi:hypothetical protein DL765_004750 [Monosporascus sp. GIB2]|nr:hypothetical protein DL765_004750 [Monosporascus sp. GIB2]
MPAPGEQHNGILNPFEEAKPRISEFTASEIATLQSRLEKQLGPEYLSARSGPSGQKVHYIAAEKCIALANEVFGFNGWSSSIQNIQVDFVDENPNSLKISLGLSVIVRVTLRDGTYHEDIGYGHIENCKGKAAAFEKAKKEGTTDALKRALRNFGNVLGNCIYDKDYLAKVTKMKVAPTKFDEDNLHRHADFARKEPEPPKLPVRSEGEKSGAVQAPSLIPGDSLDDDFGDFDMADFGVTEEGHPDEVVLPNLHGTNSNETPQSLSTGSSSDPNRPSTHSAPPRPMQPPARPMMRTNSNGPPPRAPQTPNQPPHRSGAPFQGRPNPQVAQNQATAKPQPTNPAQQTGTGSRTSTPPPNAGPPVPVAFFSARTVNPLAEPSAPSAATVPPEGATPFNPRAESPSIRKTPGIDHNSSRPVAKNGQHVPPAKKDADPPHAQSPLVGNRGLGSGTGLGPGRPGMGNAGNPMLNHTRQIGAPGGGGSPLANRNTYKPPTVKRPAPSVVEGGNRTPLTDVSANNTVNTAGNGGTDAKRQKVT